MQQKERFFQILERIGKSADSSAAIRLTLKHTDWAREWYEKQPMAVQE